MQTRAIGQPMSSSCPIHPMTYKQRLYWPSLLILLFVVWLLAAVAAQRQQAVADLKEKLAGQLLRAETLINVSPTATISCNSEHKMIVVSQAAERLFDYRAADLIGKPIDLLMPVEHRAKHIASTAKAEARIQQLPGNWYTPSKEFEGEGITRTGEVIPLLISVTTIKYGATESNPKGTVEFVARLRKRDESLPPVKTIQPLPPVREEIKKLIEKKPLT